MNNSSIRIWSIPFLGGTNPYLKLINRQLQLAGVEIMKPMRDIFEGVNEFRPGDILHFHWPSYIYTSETVDKTITRLELWRQFLETVSSKGCKIIWTVHNLTPHDNPFPELDRAARRILISYCSYLVVHCSHAAALLSQEYGRLPAVLVSPHPTLLDAYRSPYPRDRARGLFRIPEASTVFLMFGKLREYKGIELAISAFRDNPNDDTILLIVGEPDPKYEFNALEAVAGADPRVKFYPRAIRSSFVTTLFEIADVSLHAYLKILTSGTLPLAQGMGRAVIAPRMGCMVEAIPVSCGLLYEPGSRDDLAASIKRILTMDIRQMGEEAQRRVAANTVGQLAGDLLDIYRNLV